MPDNDGTPAVSTDTITTPPVSADTKITPPVDTILDKQMKIAEKAFETKKSDDQEENIKDTSTQKYKIGEEEWDEEGVKHLQRYFKTEKIEDAVKHANDNLNWKSKNAEDARKNNLTRAEAEEARRQALAEKEELANARKRAREDVLKEHEINKKYDDQIAKIKETIKAKKADIDIDDIASLEEFNDYEKEQWSEIGVLKLQRNNELASHKSSMEKLEKEEAERKDNGAKLNIIRLGDTYPDIWNSTEILSQISAFNDFKASEEKAGREVKDPKVLDNYPDLKKFLGFKNWADKNNQIDLATAWQFYVQGVALQKAMAESKEWETKLATAEKKGYDKAYEEIKAKGITVGDLEKTTKKLEVEDDSKKPKGILRKQLDIAERAWKGKKT